MAIRSGKMFGFWLLVYDEIAARDAVKMGGLSVLILEINLMLFSLIGLANDTMPKGFVATGIGVAFVVIFFAFRIRAGKPAVLPYLITLAIIFLFTDGSLTFVSRVALDGIVVGLLVFLFEMIVPAFAIMLAVSGLRGWLWMRKNDVRMSF